MRTAKIVIVTVFVVVLVEVLLVEIFVRTHRFSAKEKPSWLESSFAQHARNISVPGEARALNNPRPAIDEIPDTTNSIYALIILALSYPAYLIVKRAMPSAVSS